VRRASTVAGRRCARAGPGASPAECCVLCVCLPVAVLCCVVHTPLRVARRCCGRWWRRLGRVRRAGPAAAALEARAGPWRRTSESLLRPTARRRAAPASEPRGRRGGAEPRQARSPAEVWRAHKGWRRTRRGARFRLPPRPLWLPRRISERRRPDPLRARGPRRGGHGRGPAASRRLGWVGARTCGPHATPA